jgi:hypothetical protein
LFFWCEDVRCHVDAGSLPFVFVVKLVHAFSGFFYGGDTSLVIFSTHSMVGQVGYSYAPEGPVLPVQ